MQHDSMLTRTKSALRKTFGDHRIRRVKAHRLRAYELLGFSSRTSTGLHGLDHRLLEHVTAARSRLFIEFGANDGLQQSNTYVLERDHGWQGVLIEPVPQLAAECVLNRPLAQVVSGAVASPNASGSTIGVVDADLMSEVGPSRQFSVGITLSTVIDELTAGDIGLVIVDVEGHELDALHGLDLSRHRPEFILVETARLGAVTEILSPAYSSPVTLSHHDFLFTRAHNEFEPSDSPRR